MQAAKQRQGEFGKKRILRCVNEHFPQFNDARAREVAFQRFFKRFFNA
jgi:hypothetical protein